MKPLLLTLLGLLIHTSLAVERRYYIAAVKTQWNYGNRSGPSYTKVVYREYNAGFQQVKKHQQWSGLLGPTLRGQEGDVIIVTFRNMADREYSIHPHGIAYGKQSEGALYFDNTSPFEKKDDKVLPGKEHTYYWEVTSEVAPKEADPPCLTYTYLSHCDFVKDFNSGLIGTFMVCKNGSLDSSGQQVHFSKEYVLLFGVFDESKSWYSTELTFSKNHKMYTINGYANGTVPDLNICAYTSVSWHLVGMSSEPELFSVHFNGQVLQHDGHRRSSLGLVSGTATSTNITTVHPGRWLLSSYIGVHLEAGMHGFVEVQVCKGIAPPVRKITIQQKRNSQEWTYYIAAEEITWDYAPNVPHYIDSEYQSRYLKQGPNRIGKKYKKAVFVEYVNETFTVRKDNKLRKMETGILGPVIRAQIRDIVKIVFKNKASRPYSIYPHGLTIDKDAEGAYYPEGGNQSHSVQPGETHTYVWKVIDEDEPTIRDPQCLTRMYHSAVDPVRDMASGLIGPLLICKSQSLNKRNVQLKADKEQQAMMAVFDENKSWYIDENIKTYCTDPSRVDKENTEFYNSNVMHTINGFIYDSGTDLLFCNGEIVTWHVTSVGAQDHIQTVTFYGHNFELDKRTEDVLALFPMSGETISMTMDNLGHWLLSSLNSFDAKKGMRLKFKDLECYREFYYYEDYRQNPKVPESDHVTEWKPAKPSEKIEQEVKMKNENTDADEATDYWVNMLGLRSFKNTSAGLKDDMEKIDLSVLDHTDQLSPAGNAKRNQSLTHSTLTKNSTDPDCNYNKTGKCEKPGEIAPFNEAKVIVGSYNESTIWNATRRLEESIDPLWPGHEDTPDKDFAGKTNISEIDGNSYIHSTQEINTTTEGISTAEQVTMPRPMIQLNETAVQRTRLPSDTAEGLFAVNTTEKRENVTADSYALGISNTSTNISVWDYEDFDPIGSDDKNVLAMNHSADQNVHFYNISTNNSFRGEEILLDNTTSDTNGNNATDYDENIFSNIENEDTSLIIDNITRQSNQSLSEGAITSNLFQDTQDILNRTKMNITEDGRPSEIQPTQGNLSFFSGATSTPDVSQTNTDILNRTYMNLTKEEQHPIPNTDQSSYKEKVHHTAATSSDYDYSSSEETLLEKKKSMSAGVSSTMLPGLKNVSSLENDVDTSLNETHTLDVQPDNLFINASKSFLAHGKDADNSSEKKLDSSDEDKDIVIYLKNNSKEAIISSVLDQEIEHWGYKGQHDMVAMEISDHMGKYIKGDSNLVLEKTEAEKKKKKYKKIRPQKDQAVKTRKKMVYKSQPRSEISPRGIAPPAFSPRGTRPLYSHEDLTEKAVVIGVPRKDFNDYDLYTPTLTDYDHINILAEEHKEEEYEFVNYKQPYSQTNVITKNYVSQVSGENVRVYFIAAQEVEWDYEGYGQERSNLENGPTKLTKVVFQRYLDINFSKVDTRGEVDEHLGILGPVIKAEVDETIMVFFKNLASRPYSLHAHGVSYTKQMEGMTYDDDSPQWYQLDNEVKPQDTYSYVWTVGSGAGPKSHESDCRTWVYYSAVNPERDINSGLIGPLLICRKGTLSKEMKDMREFFLLFMTFDETKSWYYEKNVERIERQNKKAVSPSKDKLKFPAINGIIYSLKGLRMYANQLVRWHVFNMGSPKDVHSIHFHGQTFVEKQKQDYRQAVHLLLPGSFATLEMLPSRPGLWLLESEVGDSQQKGMQTLFLVVDNDCEHPLGLASNSVKDNQITASKHTGEWKPHLARLHNTGTRNAWSTDEGSSDWIQVDFQRPVVISKVATQGAKHFLKSHYVLNYTISYRTDGKNWVSYKTFTGNEDSHDVKENTFFPPLIGRYIRLHPHHSYNRPTVRMEFYGCELDGCSVPLGMEDGRIGNDQITASSAASSRIHGPWHPWFGRLNAQGAINAWQAKDNDMDHWLQVELRDIKKITGIVTQGAKSLWTEMYVMAYTIQYSNDGKTWITYTDEEQMSNPKIFVGNTDNNSHVKNYIYPPIFSKFIRIVPQRWQNSITMRVELLGCDFE
uniref:ferroxidase n=1 Tax=Paramormyrops kingsleyae TaxID=1676925 RepID=A0A3B3RPT7_9TELE